MGAETLWMGNEARDPPRDIPYMHRARSPGGQRPSPRCPTRPCSAFLGGGTHTIRAPKHSTLTFARLVRNLRISRRPQVAINWTNAAKTRRDTCPSRIKSCKSQSCFVRRPPNSRRRTTIDAKAIVSRPSGGSSQRAPQPQVSLCPNQIRQHAHLSEAAGSKGALDVQSVEQGTHKREQGRPPPFTPGVV